MSRIIERKAQQLLVESGIEYPPVDVRALAEGLGIRVMEYKGWDEELSGMLAWIDDRPVAIVHNHHAPKRKRFTIAHEIAHYVLHAGRAACYDSSVEEAPQRREFRRDVEATTGENRLEIEANQFAAALLMPRDSIIEDLRSGTSTADLPRRYDVSDEAMSWRLINLNLV